MSILVVDRFKRSEATWRRVAELLGTAAVQVAPDTGAAEALLIDGHFDLILCSYRLSTESGTEFISRMRARGIEVPVIFLSTTIDTKGVLEAAGIPMADFLAAPFSSADLRHRIRLLRGETVPENAIQEVS